MTEGRTVEGVGEGSRGRWGWSVIRVNESGSFRNAARWAGWVGLKRILGLEGMGFHLDAGRWGACGFFPGNRNRAARPGFPFGTRPLGRLRVSPRKGNRPARPGVPFGGGPLGRLGGSVRNQTLGGHCGMRRAGRIFATSPVGRQQALEQSLTVGSLLRAASWSALSMVGGADRAGWCRHAGRGGAQHLPLGVGWVSQRAGWVSHQRYVNSPCSVRTSTSFPGWARSSTRPTTLASIAQARATARQSATWRSGTAASRRWPML